MTLFTVIAHYSMQAFVLKAFAKEQHDKSFPVSHPDNMGHVFKFLQKYIENVYYFLLNGFSSTGYCIIFLNRVFFFFLRNVLSNHIPVLRNYRMALIKTFPTNSLRFHAVCVKTPGRVDIL